MVPLFPDLPSSWSIPVFGKLFLYLHCSGSVSYDCTEGSNSPNLLVFENIFGVENHKWWVYHQLNSFKFNVMVYYNRSYLMILVTNVNYIHFLPSFNFLEFFYIARINNSKNQSNFTYFARNVG